MATCGARILATHLDGRIVYHHRTVDTLGKMLRAGTITQMHDAAKDFQARPASGRCRSCACPAPGASLT
jgi:hypothetical protein